jgi:hypothetical protein
VSSSEIVNRHEHGHHDVEPEVVKRRVAVRREAAHDDARDDVDQRQRAQQLPAQRQAGRLDLDPLWQRGRDVTQHRPHRELHAEVAQQEAVRDHHDAAGDEDREPVQRQAEQRDRERARGRDGQDQRPDAAAAEEVARKVDQHPEGGARVLLVARAAQPRVDRPQHPHDELARDDVVEQRQRLPHRHDQPEVAGGHGLVEAEQAQAAEHDDDRDLELDDQDGPRVARSQLAVRPAEHPVRHGPRL